MGPLTPVQMEALQKNPRFIGLKFPEIPRPETLEYRYKGKMTRAALSLMSALLRMDPNARLTAADALMHPYFDGLREAPRPQTTVIGSLDGGAPRGRGNF